MNKVELLDCTLRDGGYATNWTFGHNSIVNIFSRLVASGVDIIELGYLRDFEEFNIDRTSLPTVSDFDRVFNIDFNPVPLSHRLGGGVAVPWVWGFRGLVVGGRQTGGGPCPIAPWRGGGDGREAPPSVSGRLIPLWMF